MKDADTATLVVSPGPKERLLEKREIAMEKLRARALSAQKEREDNRLTKRNSCIKGLFDRYMRFFSKRYFGDTDVFSGLSSDEKETLAELCKSHSYKYISTNIFALAVEFCALIFYLIPKNKLWFIGLFVWLCQSLVILFMFDEKRADVGEWPFRLDYRFKFPFVYHLYKKLNPPVE